MKTPQIAPLAGMTPLGARPTLVITGHSWTETERDHLHSSDACMRGECPEDCGERFKVRPSTGRWYITMGHAGYNSPANNGDGYASKKAAESANLRYQISGRTRGLKGGSILLCEKCRRIVHFVDHCDGNNARKLTAAEGAEWIQRGRFASFLNQGAR